MSVRKLTGQDALKWIDEAQNDKEVALIHNRFTSEVGEFLADETEVIEKNSNEEDYHIVLFSYDPWGELTQVYILWTETDLFPTRGYHYQPIRPEGQTRNWIISIYYTKKRDSTPYTVNNSQV